MKIENIKEAITECERFIKTANALLTAEDTKTQSWYMTPKESGACRRASMDLTRTGSPGIVIDSGWCSASAQAKGSVETQIPMKYPVTLNAAGAVRSLGTISLLVSGIGGSSACRSAINWKELR